MIPTTGREDFVRRAAVPRSGGPELGVVLDIDGVLGVAAVQHPLRAIRRRLGGSADDRRSVMGMAGVLRALVRARPDAAVVYITTIPAALRTPVERVLSQDGYPPGRLEATDLGRSLWWLRDGRAHKRAVLTGLLREQPAVRWVLVGDDDEDDRDLFADCARRHPSQVAAIALRQLHLPTGPRLVAGGAPPVGPGSVPVVTGLNGEELLPRLAACLNLDPPGTSALDDWFLTARGRGNDASALRAWTECNDARPLVHGRSYFAALAEALADVDDGDLVTFANWRADADELLTDDGPTVGEALCAAARRGATVRGLLWRSHSRLLGYFAKVNRDLAQQVNAAGGQVLADQRVRALGCHHQKLMVVRHRERPEDDVTFIGGLDLAHSRRDDAEHHGDAQTRDFAAVYGATPAWHDLTVELRGPAVRDGEQVFRERWRDPQAVSRLPWHAVPDSLRGVRQKPSPLPPAGGDPPPAGTCAVQLLRTYPRRRPGFPFAPRGERSVARGYAKALSRAERLVYVEDQYLWSTDVARVFATALKRAPRLHLVAVVPRFPDQESPVRSPSARLGQLSAMEMVRRAGGDRVQVVNVETADGVPVYVHSKVCVIDDVWAAVGSPNLNRRSWTHDSELTAAVVDDERDGRAPLDPAGRGDGARRFARELRLELMREHLDRPDGDDTDLLDPDSAAAAVRASAAALDGWYDGGCTGPRPPGRVRGHQVQSAGPWRRRLTAPIYGWAVDPDGRPPSMRLRRTF